MLPYTELLRLEIIPPKPGGESVSREQDAKRGLDRYVHLCLKDQHPMEHTQRQNGHIGQTRFLRISTDVLHYPGVMGCSEVANKSGATIHPLEQALDKIDLDILFYRRVDFSKSALDACGDDQKKKAEILALRSRYNEAKKAEILIPARIPQELIYNLY